MKAPAKKFSGGSFEEDDVEVSDEERVFIYINGLKFVSLFASPQDLKELGAGFVLSEGLAGAKDLHDVVVEGNGIRVSAGDGSPPDALLELRSSGCSGAISDKPSKVESKTTVTPQTISAAASLLNKNAREIERYVGAHIAFLVSRKGELLFSFEDVGRHNALDKVFGRAFYEKIGLSDKLIVFSGRLSTGIVAKTARMKVPIIVSNSSALSGGIKLADELAVTLIGFARDGNFTVYSHPWRVK